ncbi:extracellular solute-binding protein [Nonomuraea terrae]|uniref:Extracellular solute-binding protein n=1 Tax=Nonomuraea terrae TaxID=2530383 RepID=A0A4R4YBY3_9ACTN|nr:extracellular solute-binding protein [Nonomuraea terrae]TDD41299.1 extracellular solute-binding protein [Nonomuraea terrae]
MWPRWSRALAAGLTATLAAGVLSGCGAQAKSQPDNKITVWSLENLTPRMAATEKIVAGFEKETGVEVRLVGVDEGQLPQLIMSAAAAGTLPDVIGGVPLAPVWQMYTNGLLDTAATKKVVDALGPGTFNANALRLTGDGSTRLGVPSDAWLQILVYRKDLFAKAGLPVPDSYDAMLKAAKTLNAGGVSGISLATDPSDVFTQQSFEDIALAGGCELVGADGAVGLGSPQCRSAFTTYDQLASDYGAPGTQSVDSTRATYFAGRSAMIVWSTFLLDELAGLRDDALPSCPQCAGNPRFLSDNSGIVTALKGPGAAEPAQFGEITSWVISRTAETAAAQKFVEYMLSTGYEGWLGLAAEGKIPVRDGTAEEPDKYREAWRAGVIGVDTRKPLQAVYSADLLDQLASGVSNMRRWGITQGQGALVGATLGELPIPKAVGAMTSDQISPAEAAQQAGEEVSALQTSLR